MKNWWMIAALALPTAAFAQSSPAGLTNYSVIPKAESFRETVFGTEVDDPYRWMESDARKTELDNWLKAASTHTTTELAKLPGYAGLLAEITAASKSIVTSYGVRIAGERMFYESLSPDADQPVLMIRDKAGDRVFLDPAAGPVKMAIGGFSPSPDGKYIYVQISRGGSEVGSGRIYDGATGRALADELTPVWGEDIPNWLDDRTILYTRLSGTQGPAVQENITTYLHRIGTPITQDVPLLGALAKSSVPVTKAEAAFSTPMVGAWRLGFVSTARADARVAIAPAVALAAGRPEWTSVADYSDQVQGADVHGDTLYYLTTAQNPDGEVRSVDAHSPTLTTSKLVLGGKDMVINNFVAGPAGLYVTTVKPEGSSRLLYLAYGAAAPVEVRLPFAGSVNDLTVSADGGSVTAAVTGWLHNTVYVSLKAGAATPIGISNTTDATLAGGARVIEETARSADGTAVPLTILAPAASRFSGARPTILETYSSYGQVSRPFFGPVTLTWVKRGGVFATCHARGGGEMGRSWHEAGRGPNKPNGHADVIACGERLIALGLASPQTLGAWGTSAGGTIVPPAALARPDLFKAVTASVGIVNATRLANSENGPMQFAEFGDPTTPAGFKALAKFDAEMLLPATKGGPDFLFTVGLNDHRVPPWNSAKVAAMMRARWGDRHLALIRADSDAGHGFGSGRDQTLALRADMYAFFLNRFGQPGFVTP